MREDEKAKKKHRPSYSHRSTRSGTIRAQRASSIDDQAIPEVINTTQYGSTPQRLLLPRSDIEILTLFNDDISSIRDDYTVWLMADPTTFRARHMTNKGNAAPVFRKAFEKKKTGLSSPPEFLFDTSRPHGLLEQTRISILSWNLRPRRGTPGAIEKHIAGKWHIIALQEAIEYLQHDSLTNHFNISHYVGCAVLFNKDTLYLDVRVSSAYVHDTKNVASGCKGR